MDKLKQVLHYVLHGRLRVEGKDRTFVRAPLWLVILAAVGGRHAFVFAVMTGLVIAGLGMTVTLESGKEGTGWTQKKF